eukprot:TRINITY_DN24772_c0_g1_i1.p1 TRINITY_DN24772_c0_g1~~TRINITY_DN24772_c0_g1_i1.p1  ORF type:complete len:891 (+),score=187.70 TRINITY_DN24772_c0_g1_i1:72-2744(+)
MELSRRAWPRLLHVAAAIAAAAADDAVVVAVYAHTSLHPYAPTNGTTTVSFEVTPGEWYPVDVSLVGTTSAGVVHSEPVQLPRWPRMLRLKSQSSDEWSFWRLWLRKGSSDHIVLEDAAGDTGSPFGDNHWWLDPDGACIAPDVAGYPTGPCAVPCCSQVCVTNPAPGAPKCVVPTDQDGRCTPSGCEVQSSGEWTYSVPELTSTATATATQQPTGTSTPYSETYTPHSLTGTVSGSQTRTRSATPVPTPSATHSKTDSGTVTQSASASPSATWSSSATSAPTASSTATVSGTRLRTGTATASPTSTASLTPSAAASATETLTHTGTAAATATRTVSVSPSAERTWTAPATVTATRTATESAAVTRTVTRPVTRSITDTATAVLTATLPSPTVTVTATVVVTATQSATRSGTSSHTGFDSRTAPLPSATATGSATASLTNVSRTLTATVTVTATSPATITATIGSATASVTAHSETQSLPTQTQTATADLTSTATIAEPLRRHVGSSLMFWIVLAPVACALVTAVALVYGIGRRGKDSDLRRSRPLPQPEPPAPTRRASSPVLPIPRTRVRLTVDRGPQALPVGLSYQHTSRGVEVLAVAPGSAAGRAGVVPGMLLFAVNGCAVPQSQVGVTTVASALASAPRQFPVLVAPSPSSPQAGSGSTTFPPPWLRRQAGDDAPRPRNAPDSEQRTEPVSPDGQKLRRTLTYSPSSDPGSTRRDPQPDADDADVVVIVCDDDAAPLPLPVSPSFSASGVLRPASKGSRRRWSAGSIQQARSVRFDDTTSTPGPLLADRRWSVDSASAVSSTDPVAGPGSGPGQRPSRTELMVERGSSGLWAPSPMASRWSLWSDHSPIAAASCTESRCLSPDRGPSPEQSRASLVSVRRHSAACG